VYIYKTTFPNGKIYIGQRSKSSINDVEYFGSGTIVTRAIKKHGTLDLVKEILIDNIDNQDALDLFEVYFQNRNPECFIENGGYNITHGVFGGDTISMHPDRNKIRKHLSKVKKGKKLNLTDKQRTSMGWASGFMRGRKLSDEHKKKLSLAHKGHFQNEEWNNNISKALKGRKQETKQCPHCNKIGSISNMKRWHFDNCKFKI